jgi:thiamine-phosphate diphosphorylase
MPLPTRIGRLRPPVLCFVVSTANAKDGDIEKLVSEAVAGGVTMVQLREREMAGGELLSLARRLKAITRGKALLVINDRVDVAIAVEADGVQIPEAGLPTLTVRGLIGKYAVLGRSIHSVEAAQAARREGAEFVIAGTMYPTASHPGIELNGPQLIEAITKDSSFPVLAIGGVKADKVEELVKAGAAGVAVTSAIAEAEDPKAAAAELMNALKEAWAGRTAAVASGAA